ncbi:MAG: DedA family protein [Flavobacteriales bacterium]|nr:DedA family protein [Flavobacteriales bacterium]
MDYIELGYFGLFLVCFLSATILPLASEAVLLAFLAYQFDPITCLLVATLGNTLGGMTNYLLGMLGKTKTLKQLMNNEAKFDRITLRIEKYSVWLGLITWLPFIGDPLTIFLGYFRVKFTPLFLLAFLGKGLRYYVIIFLWNQ